MTLPFTQPRPPEHAFFRKHCRIERESLLESSSPLVKLNMITLPFTTQDPLIRNPSQKTQQCGSERERERAKIQTQTALPNIPPTVNQP